MDDPYMHSYGEHYKPEPEEELRIIVRLMNSFFASDDLLPLFAVNAPTWTKDAVDWFERNSWMLGGSSQKEGS